MIAEAPGIRRTHSSGCSIKGQLTLCTSFFYAMHIVAQGLMQRPVVSQGVNAAPCGVPGFGGAVYAMKEKFSICKGVGKDAWTLRTGVPCGHKGVNAQD